MSKSHKEEKEKTNQISQGQSICLIILKVFFLTLVEFLLMLGQPRRQKILESGTIYDLPCMALL